MPAPGRLSMLWFLAGFLAASIVWALPLWGAIEVAREPIEGGVRAQAVRAEAGTLFATVGETWVHAPLSIPANDTSAVDAMTAVLRGDVGRLDVAREFLARGAVEPWFVLLLNETIAGVRPIERALDAGVIPPADAASLMHAWGDVLVAEGTMLQEGVPDASGTGAVQRDVRAATARTLDAIGRASAIVSASIKRDAPTPTVNVTFAGHAPNTIYTGSWEMTACAFASTIEQGCVLVTDLAPTGDDRRVRPMRTSASGLRFELFTLDSDTTRVELVVLDLLAGSDVRRACVMTANSGFASCSPS